MIISQFSNTEEGVGSSNVYSFDYYHGVPGEPGEAGQGVPTGGTTGQILAKNSNTDYDTHWVDPQAFTQVQSDWAQTNTSAVDYIRNKPVIPGVSNATITIKQGDTTKGSFRLNQSEDATITLDAGGGSQVQANWTQTDTTAPDYIKNKESVTNHISSTSNPHNTTASQVGAYTTTQTDNLLAGKASVSHTHSASDITSGELDINRIPTIPSTKTSGFADVATSGDYDDLTNKPTIPTVNDPTIRLTQGGVLRGSFSLNQANGSTIEFNEGSTSHIQSDWSTTDPTADSFIKNKPDLTQYATTTSLSVLEGRVSTVEAIIPPEASTSNPLADKEFVNSSIATQTSRFRGTHECATEAEFLEWANALTDKDPNDYTFWSHEVSGNGVYDRYKYDGTNWQFEYRLNNSSFTSVQWLAINSGITQGKVSTYDAHVSSTSNPHVVTAAQVGAYTTAEVDTALLSKANAVHTHNASDINAGVLSIDRVPTIPSTKTSGFATVATTGDYDDLTNKPVIPEVNDATITITQGGVTKGSFTVNQSGDATIALDGGALAIQSDWAESSTISPAYIRNKPDLSNFLTNSGEQVINPNGTTHAKLTVNNTVSETPYSIELADSKVTLAQENQKVSLSITNGIPQLKVDTASVMKDINISEISTTWDIHNPTVTLTQGGTTKGSFTLNQVENASIDFDAVVPQVQSDWNQTDTTAVDYIKNKPSIPSTDNCLKNNVYGQVIDAASPLEINSLTVKSSTEHSITLQSSTLGPTISWMDGQTVGSLNVENVATKSDIKDSNITITQGGSVKGSFTLNQNASTVIALDAGGEDPHAIKDNVAEQTITSTGTTAALNLTTDDEGDWSGSYLMVSSHAGEADIGCNNTYGPYLGYTKNGTRDIIYMNNIATKDLIPDVNDPTITITQGGTTKGSFSLNQISAQTIALDASAQIQSDWNQTDTTAVDFIKNKPSIPAPANNATITIVQGGTTKGYFSVNEYNDKTINIDAGGDDPHAIKDNLSTQTISYNGLTSLVLEGQSNTVGFNTGAMYPQLTWSRGSTTGTINIPQIALKSNISDAEVTFVNNGTTIGSITMNQASAETIDITDNTVIRNNVANQKIYSATSSNMIGAGISTTNYASIGYDENYGAAIEYYNTTLARAFYIPLSEVAFRTNIKDAAITITQAGSTIGSFTVNQGDNATIALHDIVPTTVTIPTSAWNNKTATISVTGVTSSNNLMVTPANSSMTEVIDKSVYCSGQGAGTLTFTCAANPTSAIEFIVWIRG